MLLVNTWSPNTLAQIYAEKVFTRTIQIVLKIKQLGYFHGTLPKNE